MDDIKTCKEHSGIIERVARCEKDIQVLFDKNNEKNKNAWQVVATIALAFLSVLINVGMEILRK